MRWLLTIAIVLCAETAAPAGPSADSAVQAVEVVGLEPTVLFPHGEPLVQIARLTVINRTKGVLRATVDVAMAGCPRSRQTIGSVAPGRSTHDVRIPDIGSPRKLKIEVRPAAGAPAAVYETTWQPQRHWVVYIVKSAHTDLGYEKAEFIKRSELARYVDDALAITDATWSLPDASRYRWTIEHLFWFNGCGDVRPWSWVRRLVDEYIKPGKTALEAPYCGMHTHWQGLEQLCRSMYWSRRHMRDRFGLDMPLYYIVDNPSVAWPAAQAWALAGGRYVVDCRQGWRTGGKDAFRHTGVPRVFWWVGPDGRHKVLFAYTTHYAIWKDVVQAEYDKMLTLVPAKLRAVENGAYGPYPYDLLLAPSYRDHDPPHKEESDHVVEWNKHWRYPELRIDDPARFMAEMERRYGDRIPTLRGDMNNYSADYSAANSDLFGRKRAAALRLATAEGLASVARLVDPAYPLDQPAVDRAYRRLCEFDDHTWPTGPAPCDFNETNFGLFKLEGARKAARIADGEIERALGALTSRIPFEGPSLVVFNPLAHARTDVASVPLGALGEKPQDVVLRDAQTGKPIPCQIDGDRLVLLARDVPPFGYKTYAIGRGGAPGEAPAGELKAGGAVLENRFYRVTFDRATGAVTSIFDKELGRELVDASAPHRFNQLIYDHRVSKTGTLGFQASPTSATLVPGKPGPVLATMDVESSEPKSGAEIRQRITLYRDVKRVDIANDLRRVRAIWGDDRTFGRQWGNVGPRYKDNVFLAFPLAVPGATIRAEYAIGTVRPHDDQLRLGSHDFLCVQQYVDSSNADYGVTWTTREAPTVHLGAIRYNQFSNTYKPEKPWLYSYAMSNRLAGLVWHHPDRACARLHYTLTSHAGAWPEGGASSYGWERGNPLIAAVVGKPGKGSLPPVSSFVSVDAPNVQMAVLKPSAQLGRGFVLRLVETEGRPQSDVHVRLPAFRLARAVACDLVENDQEPLALGAEGRGFSLRMHAYQVATVRLVPEGKPPGKVTGIEATAQSDKAVRLTWPAVEGAACYNVHRLPGPGEPPLLEDLVAQTNRTTYLDDWLDLDTAYHYRVVAVGPGNLAGQPGDEVTARTKAQNVSPPGPVRDVVAIERTCRRVSLTWRSSRESDVGAYEVFRGERPDFPLDDAHRVEVVSKPAPHVRQWYIDAEVHPATTYYYRVVAVDRHKRRSPPSAPAVLTLCDDPGPPQPDGE